MWNFGVKVPAWFALDGPMKITGTLTVKPKSGKRLTFPVALDLPLQSSLVEIRGVEIEAGTADVAVRNSSDTALVLNVYLLARPGNSEITRLDQILAPGAERTYRIAYEPPTGVEKPTKLWVGITIPVGGS